MIKGYRGKVRENIKMKRERGAAIVKVRQKDSEIESERWRHGATKKKRTRTTTLRYNLRAYRTHRSIQSDHSPPAPPPPPREPIQESC